MNLDELVTSRTVSEVLKEAGFPQHTIFKWFHVINSEKHVEYSVSKDANDYYCKAEELFGAPTAEEILKELPPYLEKKYALLVQDNGPSVTGYDAQWYVGWYLITVKGFQHCNEYRVPDNPVNSLVLAAAQAYLWWKAQS